MTPELRVLLQLGEHLKAADARQVDVEQDQPRPRRVGEGAGPAHELQGLLAVGHHVQRVAHLVELEGLPGHEDVPLVVLHQEHVDGLEVILVGHRSPLVVGELAGTVKQNLVPSVTPVSSQIRPPKYSMIFRHIARPMPVPGYAARSCRRWKIRKTRSAYCGSIPIPLSVTENDQNAPSRSAVTTMRGGCSPRELQRVAEQVLEHHGQQRELRPHRRQRPGLDHGAGLGRSARTGSPSPAASAASQATGPSSSRRPAHPAEREQVVDQHLHPLGPVHGELDVLVGLLVELAAVAALQQLAEAGDLAQRLLQVVRGDVGELLELGVGALQLGRVLRPAPRSPPAPPTAPAGCAAASMFTSAARPRISRGPVWAHLVAEVAVGDPPRLARRARAPGGSRWRAARWPARPRPPPGRSR